MSIHNTKIFLAGATGLAGTSLIKHILSCYPTISIRGSYHQSTPHVQHERLEYVRADLMDRGNYEDLFRGCRFAIMAAAATGGAGASQTSPQRQMTDNLVMDAFMLEGLYSAGIERIVYLSSATVYQEFDGYVNENQLDLNKDPHFSYIGVGWAKRSAEKLCKFWHEKYGMEIIIVRCANIYGPFARFDPSNSNFIPALIRKAVANTDPFEVWGSPKVVRDVIFADDFAEAVALLLAHQEIKCDIFNLGYGETVSVDDVVKSALKAAGHKPTSVKYTEDMPQTINFRALDCSKIKSVLNWDPKFDIVEGIRKTTNWWTENMEIWKK
jgi:nucleoside-diphosphate-sugar epimerase